MSEPTVASVATELSELRGEFRAFREEFRAVLSERKRIEPDAIYSPAEAAELVPLRPWTIRQRCRLGLLRAGGPPWKIRGAELLKLGGRLDAKA